MTQKFDADAFHDYECFPCKTKADCANFEFRQPVLFEKKQSSVSLQKNGSPSSLCDVISHRTEHVLKSGKLQDLEDIETIIRQIFERARKKDTLCFSRKKQ